MNRILRALLLVVAVALASSATVALAQTATPLSAATPAAQLKKTVGTSANFMKFIAGGACLADPASVAAGAAATVSCSVPGALPGDYVGISMDPTAGTDRDCLLVQGSIAGTDVIWIKLVNNITVTNPCDPGLITFKYLLARLNPSAQ